MSKEIIKCVKCKKIMIENELNKILEAIGKDNYIECPYCGYQHNNPYRK